jgi:hypothetical protein
MPGIRRIRKLEPTESLRALSRRFVETSWCLPYCANVRFRNKPIEVDLLGFLRCKKVLRYQFDWRYI